MKYQYSNKISAVQPSAIREILKISADPSIIRFSAGNPAPDAFPVADVQRIAGDLLSNHPIEALQYGLSEGDNELRIVLASYLQKKEQIGGAQDAILITNGAQQVMDLAAKCFLNEGDCVVCESPSFIGSLNCFRSYGARLVGVSMEQDGMNIDALKAVLEREKNVKLIYTIPNFQNPTGATLSLEKRKQLYTLAKAYGALVIEDNPYGDTRVTGKELPSIKSMDKEGIVIYAGSFSKILSPGLRVGYAVVPSDSMGKLTVAKQCVDVHTPMLNQMIVRNWLSQCDVAEHIHKIQSIYRNKLNLMCDLIDQELKGFFQYVRPEGGLFLWCKVADEVNMTQFVQQAMKRGVAMVPGNAFLVNETEPCQYVRLNFSTPTEDEIRRGVHLLAETKAAML